LAARVSTASTPSIERRPGATRIERFVVCGHGWFNITSHKKTQHLTYKGVGYENEKNTLFHRHRAFNLFPDVLFGTGR